MDNRGIGIESDSRTGTIELRLWSTSIELEFSVFGDARFAVSIIGIVSALSFDV